MTDNDKAKVEDKPVNPPQAPKQDTIQTNDQFCSIVHTTFFSPTQCDAVMEACEKELWITGEVDGGGVNKKLRDVKQQGLMMNDKGWPHTRILELVQQANEAKYKFKLSGFMNYDAPMIMQYNAPSGHYDWHVDLGKNVPNRKLSFTIQLSNPEDYEGGDLEFVGTDVKTEAFRQRGTCIIFPSFLPHRITPVTKGIRNAIVGWIHGPTFV